MGDSGLTRPGQPVQPVDRGLVEVPGPEFDLVQNSSACPLEAPVPITMPKFGPLGATEIVEDSRFGYRGFKSGNYIQKQMGRLDLSSVGGLFFLLRFEKETPTRSLRP